MEYIDIVDQNNKLTGEVRLRKEIHKQGLLHRGCNIWLFNQNNKLLIQKRSKSKDLYPGKWATSVSGHVEKGEEPIYTIIREVKEEIGIDINIDALKLIDIYKIEEDLREDLKNNRFEYFFFARVDKKINEYILQPEEVERVKYIDLKKLENIVSNKNHDYTFAHRLFMPQVLDKIKKYLDI